MKEYQPPEAAIDPKSRGGKVPISAYFLALISGVFVTFGVMIFVAFSHLFVGDLISSAPRPVLVAIPYIAIALGILSAWQSLRQAKRKAVAKTKAA